MICCFSPVAPCRWTLTQALAANRTNWKDSASESSFNSTNVRSAGPVVHAGFDFPIYFQMFRGLPSIPTAEEFLGASVLQAGSKLRRGVRESGSRGVRESGSRERAVRPCKGSSVSCSAAPSTNFVWVLHTLPKGALVLLNELVGNLV